MKLIQPLLQPTTYRCEVAVGTIALDHSRFIYNWHGSSVWPTPHTVCLVSRSNRKTTIAQPQQSIPIIDVVLAFDRIGCERICREGRNGPTINPRCAMFLVTIAQRKPPHGRPERCDKTCGYNDAGRLGSERGMGQSRRKTKYTGKVLRGMCIKMFSEHM